MGPIKNIGGMPANIGKTEKNSDYKKINEDKDTKKDEGVKSTAQGKDRLEISAAAQELLTINKEANDPRFIKEVIDAETMDASELAAIKNRIEEGYYANPEVVDSIVDKLFDLPNFAPKTIGRDGE